tara:strand:- start:3170 stop:3559 length:390 start_codon:yes stop_codon:yes gene_type:complete
MSKTTATIKYIKSSNFESQLFKVMEYDNKQEDLLKVLKVWDNSKFLYIKDKYLPNNLVSGKFYKCKMTFGKFEKDGDEIVYINAVRLKETGYIERRVTFDIGILSDSDDEILEYTEIHKSDPKYTSTYH